MPGFNVALSKKILCRVNAKIIIQKLLSPENKFVSHQLINQTRLDSRNFGGTGRYLVKFTQIINPGFCIRVCKNRDILKAQSTFAPYSVGNNGDRDKGKKDDGGDD